MKRGRVAATAAVAAAVIGIVAFLPLPYHVDTAVEVQPADGYAVYALVPGQVSKWHHRPGDVVAAGEPIVELDSLDLRLKQATYQGELEIANVRLSMMQSQRIDDDEVSVQLGAQREIRDSAEQKLVNVNDRIEKLLISSPVDGVIIPPPKKSPQKDGSERLPTWSGDPFEAENERAVFSEGDLLCYVGDPNRMEGVLVIDQADIDLVQLEDEVDLKLDFARLETYTGKISQISQTELKEISPNMGTQSGGWLDTEMTEDGRMKPISTSYQARVPLDHVKQTFRPGYRGQAKIYVGWKSLGWRLYRFLSRTFHFEL